MTTSIEYESGFDFCSPGLHYYISTQNFHLEEIECDLCEEEIKCDICGAPIFPEPGNYCEHVMFIYAEEYEGLWAYISEEAKEYIKVETNDQMDINVVGKVCGENNWSVTIYVNEMTNTYGRPKLFIGIKG